MCSASRGTHGPSTPTQSPTPRRPNVSSQTPTPHPKSRTLRGLRRSKTSGTITSAELRIRSSAHVKNSGVYVVSVPPSAVRVNPAARNRPLDGRDPRLEAAHAALRLYERVALRRGCRIGCERRRIRRRERRQVERHRPFRRKEAHAFVPEVACTNRLQCVPKPIVDRV